MLEGEGFISASNSGWEGKRVYTRFGLRMLKGVRLLKRSDLRTDDDGRMVASSRRSFVGAGRLETGVDAFGLRKFPALCRALIGLCCRSLTALCRNLGQKNVTICLLFSDRVAIFVHKHRLYSPPMPMKTVISSEYEALFRQHFRLAVLYAERILGSVHEAEDVVQEVFIALLDVDLSQIRHRESYLYRCVRNAALDRLHRRMKTRVFDLNSQEIVRLADESPIPGAEEQALVEQIGRIYRRIEALPEQGRRIFKMICIEHKSYVETARLLSLSLHTVKTHMARSFKALRKKGLFLLGLF